MSLGSIEGWQGRRKRWTRRIARDLRLASPGLWIVLCFTSTATTITIAERVPVGPYFTISMSSTSNTSAAPAGIRPFERRSP